MPPTKPSKHEQPPLTHRLLLRGHSPTTAASIHSTKFLRKPLRLLATPSTTAISPDSRTLRASHRSVKAAQTREARRRKGKGRGPNSLKKPRPLTAAEKRKLGVYEIPKEELKRWDIYLGLHELWCGYIREVLGVGEAKAGFVVVQNAGAVLASADFHGAMVQVVRCRCVGRVGVKGVVVRDTKFAFLVVGEGGRLWSMYIRARYLVLRLRFDADGTAAIPKEHTIFRFEVPLSPTHNAGAEGDEATTMGNTAAESEASGGVKEKEQKNLVFELHGEQFKNRAAPERAKKQFKIHFAPDL